MKQNYIGFIKPLIKEVITDIYNNDEVYLNFFYSDEFTDQEKQALLVKMTYKRIKLHAINSRINACIKENDSKALIAYTRELAHMIIALEQSIYQVAHTDDDTDTGGMRTEVTDLYGGIMAYESTELFEGIKDSIEAMEYFQGEQYD